jgi:hypothetical protein
MCKVAVGSTGLYKELQQCESACPPLKQGCTGASANLTSSDCSAWQKFVENPLYTKLVEGKCPLAHTDPCSCKFHDQTHCANGRITIIDMSNQGLPASGGIPLALLDLTGLSGLFLGGSGLQGTIPVAIGTQLQQLTGLDLSSNALSGTVPESLTTLKHLTNLGLNQNPHLSGVLPAFNFSQVTCCGMFGDVFTCPLPAGANTCVGGPACGKYLPPTCK